MTLPTRDDGGIDWDRIIFPTEKDISYGWIISGHKIHRVSAFEFNQTAIAHTRERCAKCGEGVTYPYPTKELEDYRRGYHDGASDVVDAIRKMED